MLAPGMPLPNLPQVEHSRRSPPQLTRRIGVPGGRLLSVSKLFLAWLLRLALLYSSNRAQRSDSRVDLSSQASGSPPSAKTPSDQAETALNDPTTFYQPPSTRIRTPVPCFITWQDPRACLAAVWQRTLGLSSSIIAICRPRAIPVLNYSTAHSLSPILHPPTPHRPLSRITTTFEPWAVENMPPNTESHSEAAAALNAGIESLTTAKDAIETIPKGRYSSLLSVS